MEFYEECEDRTQEVYEKTMMVINNENIQRFFNVSILQLSDFGNVLLKAETKNKMSQLESENKLKELLPNDIKETFKTSSIQSDSFIFEIEINV